MQYVLIRARLQCIGTQGFSARAPGVAGPKTARFQRESKRQNVPTGLDASVERAELCAGGLGLVVLGALVYPGRQLLDFLVAKRGTAAFRP